MAQVSHAIDVFFAHLTAISWRLLAVALVFQLLKTAARTRAQRNILAAAYPTSVVRWRTVFGAYLAGAGVNALIPVRGGDLLRLFLIRHRIDGSSYPTLVAASLVELPFDLLASVTLLAWAVQSGALPGLRVVQHLPALDWFWLFRHPRAALVVVLSLLILGIVVWLLAASRVAAFRERFGQGFTILHTPTRYLRLVVLWQAVDWGLRIAAIWFFLRAFRIEPSLDSALRVQLTQTLSTIVPLTPAGIGTEQALAVHLLSGRASTGFLVSFSVGVKLILSVWSILLGAIAILLMARTLRWRRMLSDPPTPPQAPPRR